MYAISTRQPVKMSRQQEARGLSGDSNIEELQEDLWMQNNNEQQQWTTMNNNEQQ